VILIETTLGHMLAPEWRDRLAAATVDALDLDQWEAQKSRLRKATEGGLELALSLERGVQLRDGDVLHWDAAARRVVVARIALNEVMVVEIGPALAGAPEAIVRTVFELGHALGNQHWPAIVKGNRVYVPLTVDRKVMASVMKTHAFADITYGFAPGIEVLPYMTPHEARRLFGGAGQPSHAHPHVHGPSHDHGHDHPHGHAPAPATAREAGR
jgi:urease accessory protein